ncbi:MAG: DNA-binding protein, partial [Eggerthella sp.]
REEDVMQRAATRPSAGRPRKADVPSPADDSKPHAAASELYRACKDHLAACPSAAEIAAIDDPEQAAFRIAVADFFLQRKQSELVRQGVF